METGRNGGIWGTGGSGGSSESGGSGGLKPTLKPPPYNPPYSLIGFKPDCFFIKVWHQDGQKHRQLRGRRGRRGGKGRREQGKDRQEQKTSPKIKNAV